MKFAKLLIERTHDFPHNIFLDTNQLYERPVVRKLFESAFKKMEIFDFSNYFSNLNNLISEYRKVGINFFITPETLSEIDNQIKEILLAIQEKNPKLICNKSSEALKKTKQSFYECLFLNLSVTIWKISDQIRLHLLNKAKKSHETKGLFISPSMIKDWVIWIEIHISQMTNKCFLTSNSNDYDKICTSKYLEVFDDNTISQQVMMNGVNGWDVVAYLHSSDKFYSSFNDRGDIFEKMKIIKWHSLPKAFLINSKMNVAELAHFVFTNMFNGTRFSDVGHIFKDALFNQKFQLINKPSGVKLFQQDNQELIFTKSDSGFSRGYFPFVDALTKNGYISKFKIKIKVENWRFLSAQLEHDGWANWEVNDVQKYLMLIGLSSFNWEMINRRVVAISQKDEFGISNKIDVDLPIQITINGGKYSHDTIKKIVEQDFDDLLIGKSNLANLLADFNESNNT